MPGRGPVPAENRRRRNADVYADVKTHLTEDDGGELRGPELPGSGYLVQVQEWYDVWRRSPQAAAFLSTDWQRLHMLAPLVQSYWIMPSEKKMAEIRQNESLLGATHADRLRGRIKVEQDKPAAPSAPTSSSGVSAMETYRKRLAG